MTKNKENRSPLSTDSSYKTKKLAILGLITAISYISVFLFRIPIIPSVPFLDLEFKSAVILIGAFMFGPLSGLLMAFAVCVIEMLTISHTGIIGCIMNILPTVCFVCPAAFIYKRKRTLSRAIIGISVGSVLMTFVMVLWNYLITPIFMGVPRDAVVSLLVPAIIPFNIIKAALNGSVTLLLYKFIVTALRKANLIPREEGCGKRNKSAVIGSVIIAGMVIITCVLVILAFNGVF
ncbi:MULTISPECIES: ECF transporter S component [unclassified Ruminococcus]|uniref:ECF transporter S component n=1 Tax=unclassified Ruminococcus TaxID=2608920 RepID=UPI00210B8C37|nr:MULTISPECIES: ECF transporter S component [unclassified Ruminococcus]MCQ4023342.1 ECF transporter S component [Ruminococcus sp. zg-924]MCQ4115378.1 ECF transporter S component [Ruminococcus sp. zg-921]